MVFVACYLARHINLPMHTAVVPCFDVWVACKLIWPASLDFNQACYTKFATVLPFCSCKNTTGDLSLSSVKFFCALQAISGHLYHFRLQSSREYIVVMKEFLILHGLAKKKNFWAMRMTRADIVVHQA